MSDKYIIKNCSCYDNGFCTARSIYVAGCSQCTDCVLKQIVELCKGNQKLKWQVGQNPEEWISFNNPLSYQILQLLDIQEVK